MSEIVNVETELSDMDAVSKKIQDLNVEVAKINTSLESIKKYSDELSNELLLSDEDNTEDLETKLEKLKVDLELAKNAAIEGINDVEKLLINHTEAV